MRPHPEHDAVSSAVRSWFTASTPAIGLSVTSTSYGFLTDSDRANRRRLVLTLDALDGVSDALAAAARFYGTQAFDVWVDDRLRAERLAPALVSAGLEPAQETVVLALVGPIDAGPGPSDLAVENVVDAEQLEEWAEVKIRGFADDEARPAPARIQAEVAERRAEWAICRFQLVRIDGEAVAVLAHYTGQDQMVFNLATRLPFRHRGIGQSLLARWSREAGPPDVRSHLINCDDGGPAHALYRRLGFTDEVYWYRPYGPRK